MMGGMGALYRRKRPTRFDAVVGQEHVKEVLQNAIRKDRLAQAYLFSGPRGVGKTTVARLLAMAVGCQAPPAERPCGACEHCRRVAEGRHPDVLEIDAASNNSVDDVRALKERLLLAPLLAPKKVVILDEAHMMSKSAFNALLKTLEEPPEHVLFVFATTEPERLPATIKSRTQHFRFRRLREEEIAGKLRAIAEEAGIEVEEDALRLIARAAEGAMRDAESLFERVLALAKSPFTRADAEALLGLPPEEVLAGIADRLLAGEVEAALEEARARFLEGYAPRTLVTELKRHLRDRLMERPDEAVLGALLALDEADEVLARNEGPLALELALLRAYRAARPAPASPRAPDPASPPAPKPPPPPPREPAPAELTETAWRDFLEALPITLRAVVREARPALKGGALVLRFAKPHRFHYERTRAALATLAPLAKKRLGAERVEAVHDEADEEPAEEPPPAPPPEAAAAPPAREEGAAGPLADPRLRRLAELFRAELKAWGEEPLSNDS